MHLLQMLTLNNIFTNICELWGSEVKIQGKKKVSLAEHEIGMILTTQAQQLVLWRQLESRKQHTLLCDC